VLAWALALAAGIAWDALTAKAPAVDVASFLPDDSPHNIAMQLVRRAFPDLAARSQIVIVGHRPSGLTAGDLAWLNRVAQDAAKATGRRVLSPAMPFFNRRLVSRDGQVAMVLVNLQSNFLSGLTVASVERIDKLLQPGRPAGLVIEVTGTAGIGRDYSVATKKAFHTTTWVTIVAVLVILVVIYRSPVGAMVPLVAIGASVYLAFILLAMLSNIHWPVSDIDRIFTVVLLFGAGVDYALFWIARYRETLVAGHDFESAAITAARTTSPAIIASAGTTICGLSMMMTAQIVPSHNAGRILAPVLVISLVAALTLSPALARLLGRGLFWPVGLAHQANLGQRFVWPALASLVARRPRTVLLVGLVVLGLPALAALRLAPRFDTLAELPPNSSCDRGYKILNEHFPVGQLFSTQLALKFEKLPAAGEIEAISAKLGDRIAGLAGVGDVYSLADPLGQRGPGPKAALADALVKPLARGFYVSEVLPVLRFEVLAKSQPFSLEAMALIEQVRTVAKAETADLGRSGHGAEVLLAGFTPYITDVRAYSGSDQIRVMILATLVIGLIVLALVRDVPLTLFMLLATWITYGATLTLSDLFLCHLLGQAGLDWKVRLILFVIVVAVGQDYNIFLVSRLLGELNGRTRSDDLKEPRVSVYPNEPRALARAALPEGTIVCGTGVLPVKASPCGTGVSLVDTNSDLVGHVSAEADEREATRRAIVSTGSVISSCGIIMAATLGSLWAGGLTLLRQVGFAMALGVLIDTFLVRPLLVPSFFLATGRARRHRPPPPAVDEHTNRQD
jgi:RND superfamily putative drug exporter